MSDVNTITTRPVYLHFLDRELGHSVGFQLSPTVLERSLKCLLLGSASVLYCGISVIWENNNIGQDSLRVLAALTEADALQPVSYKGSLDEFLGSRQRLYRHDAERYPLYFGRNQDYLYSIRPSLHKKDDTTNSLQESLLVWSSHQGRSSNEFEKLAQRVVLSSLLTRDEQAITFSYFATGMRHDGIVAEAEGELRRRISYAYTEHYLDFVNGDIATGVKGLSYFDEQLTRDFPRCDLPTLALVLRSIGLGNLLLDPWADRDAWWSVFLQSRATGLHRQLAQNIDVILRTLHDALPRLSVGGSQFAARHAMHSVLGQFLEISSATGCRGEPNLENSLVNCAAIIRRMSRRPEILAILDRNQYMALEQYADALLVTATPVETRAILDAFAENGLSAPRRRLIGDNTYFDFGEIGGHRVLVVQSEPGSGGTAGSLLTVHDAITQLRPSFVIAVGIAFGVDPSWQHIGDVLISRQVLSYELQRLGASGPAGSQPILRGDRVTASSRLLGWCQNAGIDWHGCPLHFGLFLSGEKLIDNRTERDRLVALAGGEVIGGEMEGAGLYAAAHRQKVDWIVVKGICDWADGRKSYQLARRQALAAANAARFVCRMLGPDYLPGRETGHR